MKSYKDCSRLEKAGRVLTGLGVIVLLGSMLGALLFVIWGNYNMPWEETAIPAAPGTTQVIYQTGETVTVSPVPVKRTETERKHVAAVPTTSAPPLPIAATSTEVPASAMKSSAVVTPPVSSSSVSAPSSTPEVPETSATNVAPTTVETTSGN